MTIIIGIKCTNGIVIACDSRTTQKSGHVNDDAQKLSVVTFRDGNSGVVGQAGNDDLSSRAVEIILRLAKERDMSDYRSLPDCAREAIVQLKDGIREQVRGTAEELQKHFEDHAFELMLACYHGSKPYIFTVDFALGEVIKKDKLHCSIGCGWILADFIISRLDIAKFTTGHGMWTAIYAVEEIKKFDARCGGKTKSAVVTTSYSQRSDAALSFGLGMEETVAEALEFSEEEKRKWAATAEVRIHKLVERREKRDQKQNN